MGLKINKEKTKTMRINARNQEKIIINGQDIEDVDDFVYLGAKVCKEEVCMKDMKTRLSKARGAFDKLKKIWNSNNISRRTKMRLYKTLVLPALLYGFETCKMNKGDDKAVPTKDPPNPMARPCQYQRAAGKSGHEATECGSDVS